MTFYFEGIELGILFIRWNGILIGLGIAIGAWFSARQNGELVYALFLPASILGVVGARLWYIFTPPLSSIQLGLTTQHYLSSGLDSLALWVGGYGIPGLWIGGLIALIFVSRQQNLPFWHSADILAPGLALAQSIGRLGNYFNQELYGLPTNIFCKIFIAPEYRLAGYESIEYYHPLFAYEATLSFINFILLFWLARKNLKSGSLFLAYVIFYSSTRFLLEFLRLDIALVNGINANQVFFAITLIFSSIYLFLLTRPTKTVSSL